MARPETMVAENKSMTFGELIKLSKIEEAVEMIAERRAKEIVDDGIDEMGEFLKKRLGLDYEKRPDWPDIKETFYRRNIIVHNDGEANDDYRRKTGNSKAGTLNVSKSYLDKRLYFLTRFSADFSKDLAKKFMGASLKPHRPVPGFSRKRLEGIAGTT
ncbi:MAG: hypothetical protein JRM79_05025 [Nitrososphaerota archaeon]|nr:hypothetical protein [Nitrososphaerota archaeon]MDG6937188.1 hypothetical protein [Nitrososphaerota archaeon]MDG6958988.1 hypothetical protein [Nitrososphaerota archaeon]MDG6970301.1 hypothetical protein [Nitrososphaerota archaeon]MDG6986832.1 hypothetical protein [Nitrososphaerota archaeon]